MFKTLYRCPRTISRHENGPLYESRRHYLDHLAAQGATRRTIRGAAEVIYRAAIYMRLDSSSPVERTDVEQAAKDWANRPFGNANLVAPGHAMKEFRLVMCSWLRFAGRLKEPGRVPGPRQCEIDTYCRYIARSFASYHRDRPPASRMRDHRNFVIRTGRVFGIWKSHATALILRESLGLFSALEHVLSKTQKQLS